MSNAQDRARLQLEEQLRQLGELRNASTRDSGFRQWRQNTLTLIQRLWPSHDARAERFRRVSFSSPSSRLSPSASRAFYERGCAEAAEYLKSLIAEMDREAAPATHQVVTAVEDGGAAEPREEVAPPSVEPAAPTLPAVPETHSMAAFTWPAEPLQPSLADWIGPAADGIETSPSVSLEASEASPPPLGDLAEPPQVVPRGGLKEILGFAEPSEPATPPLPKPTSVSDPGSAPAPPGPVWHDFQSALRAEIESPPPASSATPAGAASADQPAPLAAPAAASSSPEVAPKARPTASRAARSGARETPKRSMAATAPDEETPSRLRKLASKPASEESAAPAPLPSEEPKSHETMAEFLASSPVLRAQPKPVHRARPARGTISSPIATTLAAMAAEIERFDVPEGQRAGARALLLDLARRVDENRLGWEDMRHAMNFVMDCPPLARRVVPLLLPFLDKAA